MKAGRFLAFWLGMLGAALWAAAAGAAVPEGIGKRVALVIGNSAYRNAVTLPNPERDAKSLADKLRELGFVVVEGYDLDHDGMEDVIKDFSKAVHGAEIGMFFYAGHGMQVNGKNYLVPIDAAFQDISSLDFEAIPMELITRQMQNEVSVRLVILDACRDNPLSKTLSRSLAGTSRSGAIAEGLAEVKIVDAGEGTAIIFATSPDEVALDGEGDHSPFTTALLNNIGAPDTDLPVVMSRITGEVYNSTKKQQRPWINASLTGSVFLNPQQKLASQNEASAPETEKPGPAATGAPGGDETLQRETILYNLARESGQREDYQAYLENFPNGLYAKNARKQIERLDQAEKEKVVASFEPPANSVPDGGVPRAVVAPPLVELPITDVVRAMPSGPDTETALDFDKAKRAEIQTRLNAIGFEVGTPDGSWGGKTRKALQAWQSSRGLPASGYLNQPQYEILMQQSEPALVAYVAPPAVSVPASPSRKAVTRSSEPRNIRRDSRPRNKTVRRGGGRRGGASAEQLGRFVGGVIRGLRR